MAFSGLIHVSLKKYYFITNSVSFEQGPLDL